MPECNDQNETPLEEGQQVLIVGTIASVTPGAPCIVAVTFMQGGTSQRQEFNANELVKAIEGSTITGVLSGPT